MNNNLFPEAKSYYQGKVRDVYAFEGNKLVMITSDRISAFDVILPRTIPYKGQVLNQIAAYMLEASREICPNWLEETPLPTVSIGKQCNPYAVEVVVRAYLTGHAWREYKNGKRILCGIVMPEGMNENDAFPAPIITPSTKAVAGHDEDITEDEIIERGLMQISEWNTIKAHALSLFKLGTEMAAGKGLILVDTKYEFGHYDGEIMLMDEIHTPDSSRYFYKAGYNERQQNAEPQKQLSKEFVREWLIENQFMGKEGEAIPEMTDEWVNSISSRYIELYEILIGESFHPANYTNNEIVEHTRKSLDILNSNHQ